MLGCLLPTFSVATAAETNAVPGAAPAAASDSASFAGKVIEATNVAGYTYVQVDTGSKKLWAVTTQFAVKPGDRVTVASSMAMPGYHSKSLNRDFDVVYFTSRITVDGDNASAPAMPGLPPGHPAIPGASVPGLPPGHPALGAAAAAPNLDLTGIKKAEGGKTIAEIYAAKSKLAGQSVSVRGKVVKYHDAILGKNWLHIQDGTGSAGSGDNDLTVTTTLPAAPGNLVLVSGILSTNRDFGAGYKYAVIIEDAKVTVE